MTGKLIRYQGYNYQKNGIQKVGRSITIQSTEAKAENDENGNFTYGLSTEDIFIRGLRYTDDDIVEMLGKIVDIKMGREIGERYDRVQSIEVIS